MAITSELDIRVKKLVLQKRRDEALKLLESFGFDNPEIQVQAVEARIKEQWIADQQKYIDYAHRRGLA